ncbi:MAG: hypothetical protein WA634_06120 [Silvibacterium sp.]
MPIKSALVAALLVSSLACAQQTPPPPVALTIYNQNFAVARTSVDLDLHPGINEVTTTRVTSQLEPDSVVLRDPTGEHTVQVIEQNYDAAVVNQAWMLKKYEGRTISFQIKPGEVVQGKIIRAGDDLQPYGAQQQPLIEVNSQMQFQLPGLPLFPATTDGLLLKPTLRWQIQSAQAEHYTAELAYITAGLDWEATYNVIAPQSSNVPSDEKADVLGWVTIHNQSGSDFPEANIKLMAGDVAKIMPQLYLYNRLEAVGGLATAGPVEVPKVTQKAFDDFHLYNLNRTVTLRDGETKQVQFLDAPGVTMQRSYSYDGSAQNRQPFENYSNNIIWDEGYGLDSGNTKVRIIEEIKNSKSNHLGIPLPAGRVRVYRRDSDGQMEFVGESMIEHTPPEETLKVSTGNAFDVKGARKQTDFHVDQNAHTIDETFEIKLTNQKQQPVKVTVVEHMYRGNNWEITAKSTDYIKRDSHTIEFPVHVAAKGEATLIYSVHYTW